LTEPAVVVEGVSKKYRLYRDRNQSLKQTILQRKRARYEDYWALRDVSFEIPEGSTFGLIGENGSGKSTMLKCIARILRPDEGSVRSRGTMAALLELGSGFHPELSGRENVYLNGAILGLSKREIDRRFDEIVDFAGIETFIDQPVKNYSTGMYVRLGFSVAINVDPDILLVDEVLAVGDSAFQQKCLEKFAEYRRAGKTVVIVSHAMGTLRTMCDSVVWLDHGRVVGAGNPQETVDEYLDRGHTERTTDDSGVTRWGSGEAQVGAVELIDGAGRQTTLVRTGDDVIIRLHWVAHQPVETPVFGVGIETVDGAVVTDSNTREAGLAHETLHGTGFIDFRIPRLMLLPGAYDLQVSLTDRTAVHTYDFMRHCLRFDVEHGSPREAGGIVSLGGSWHKMPATDEAPLVPRS
jgi:ABC-2 type transport system ATP-binding protein